MIRAFESVFNYWEGVKLGLVVVGEKERGSNHRSAPGDPAAAKRNPEKTEYAMWECSPTSGFEARAFALYLQDVIPHAPQLQRTTIQTASTPCRREKPKPLRALTSWPPVTRQRGDRLVHLAPSVDKCIRRTPTQPVPHQRDC